MRHFDVASAPHLPIRPTVTRVMLWVLIALLPGIALQAWLFGIGVLLQILIALIFALGIEALFLRLLQRLLRPALLDGSAAVTAVLFALCLPPLAPWWISALGLLIGIGLGKQVYGGLGYNLFNPAMVAYAAMLVSFPAHFGHWPAPLLDNPLSLGDVVRAVFIDPQAGLPWDTLAQATPLDQTRQALRQSLTLTEWQQRESWELAQPHAWHGLALAWLLGGLLLLWRRIAAWQVPVGVLLGVMLTATPIWLTAQDQAWSPLAQFGWGGLVLAAFFIATDPVSGCATPKGRWLFGIGVGALTILIRQFGSYPDGIAFAVLLMNAAAPWIDLHTRPRYYGEPT
ncbi:MAG: RnfABCDGE type electron transport complex subunit D [Lysobacteraceae bacterium]